RTEMGLEGSEIRCVIGPVNHAMTVRAQDREVHLDIVRYGDTLLEQRHRLEMVRLDIPLAERPVWRTEVEVTCLARHPVELLCLGARPLISFYLAVHSIAANFRQRARVRGRLLVVVRRGYFR